VYLKWLVENRCPGYVLRCCVRHQGVLLDFGLCCGPVLACFSVSYLIGLGGRQGFPAPAPAVRDRIFWLRQEPASR
jgi:hypothetical protein